MSWGDTLLSAVSVAGNPVGSLASAVVDVFTSSKDTPTANKSNNPFTPVTRCCGNNDKSISDFLKVWIIPTDGSGDKTGVCGVLGPGTSKEITANWQSPFEGESIGNKFQLSGGLFQALTGHTLIQTLNSRQVWNGNQPTKFNVEVKFYALSDVQKEVMSPLTALETMIAPQTDAIVGLGRTPGGVILNIGTKVIYKNCVLESISQPYDKEVYRNGGYIRCTVNLQISTIAMLNKTDVPKFGA